MLNLFRNSARFLLPTSRVRCVRQASNLFEPDYLAEMKPKYPVYACVNIQIKGYDFPVLESYQRFLHRTAQSLDLDVTDSWATPAQHMFITKLKPQSTTVDGEFNLKIYERNIQLYNLPAYFYPVYLRMISAATPEGVTMNIIEHQPEHEEIRYVPDTELKQLQTELEDLGGARKQKRKKK